MRVFHGVLSRFSYGKKLIVRIISPVFLILSFAIPAKSQPYGFERPSLLEVAACGVPTRSYVSQAGWTVSSNRSCLSDIYGNSHAYASATKNNRLIIWDSVGGSGIQDYNIFSINLDTGSYIEYLAVIGIRGDGFINSTEVINLEGDELIPIRDFLSIIEWERGFGE